MFKIDCYEEKRLLIAYYFCGKTKVSVTPKSVLELWNNWWKYDFTKRGKHPYKVDGINLVANEVDTVDKDHLYKANRKFRAMYQWLEQYLDDNKKERIKQQIVKLRKRQLHQLQGIAREKGLYLIAPKPLDEVANAKLAQYRVFLRSKKGIRDDNFDKTKVYLEIQRDKGSAPAPGK